MSTRQNYSVTPKMRTSRRRGPIPEWVRTETREGRLLHQDYASIKDMGRGLWRVPNGYVQICPSCSRSIRTDWILVAEFVQHWGCLDCRMRES
jgi:hypothetical protein